MANPNYPSAPPVFVLLGPIPGGPNANLNNIGPGPLLFTIDSSGHVIQTYANGIVAHAGGGQANALLLTGNNNRIATVATIGDSVLLPPAVPGMRVAVTNGTANSVNVFPSSAAQGGVVGGDAINALGANAAYALAGAKTAYFICSLLGQWDTILTA